MIDYCTLFSEHWIAWVDKWDPWRPWRIFKLVYIGGCCEIHDATCKAEPFSNCLVELNVVGSWFIVAGGSIGCWWQKLVGLEE